MTNELMENNQDKQELSTPAGIERTRTRKVFVPRSDIYEAGENIIVLADMPGVDETSVDITLEKNILTIDGRVEADERPGYSLSYAEYSTGDYHRVFTLSNEVDRDNIVATVKNGVLKLTLPKSPVSKARKIAVNAQ